MCSFLAVGPPGSKSAPDSADWSELKSKSARADQFNTFSPRISPQWLCEVRRLRTLTSYV